MQYEFIVYCFSNRCQKDQLNKGKTDKKQYKGNEMFSVIEVQIFEIYTSTACERYIAWWENLGIAKVTDEHFCQ